MGKPPVRIAYVGPFIDLAMAAYQPHHDELGHQVEWYLDPDHLPRAPAPDVVVIAPLMVRNGRVEGPCYVSGLVPSTTLIVALGMAEGSSHAMWIRHALNGHCHPRILIHYPKPGYTGEELVGEIDQAVRRVGPVAKTTWGIPEHLDLVGVTADLGELMEDPAWGEFLYVAATNSTWSTWQDLAIELNLVAGTVKNRMSAFGRRAVEVGLLPDNDGKFRAGQFVRYVTEHRSFIRAHYQHFEAKQASEQESA